MRLVDEARKWIGTPFKHQGRDQYGIDCVGHCRQSLAASGLELADVTDYPRDPHNGRLPRVLTQRLGLPVNDLQVGDIALIAFPKVSRHLAIVGNYTHGGLSLIHAWTGSRTVTEHRLDEKWRKRIVAVYRPVIP